MSSDEDFLARVAAALNKVQLDAVVVGNTASILHGAPVMTEDVDLFILDTPKNRKKFEDFARRIGGSSPVLIDETSKVLRIYADTVVDAHFWIGESLRFGAVRARSRNVRVGKHSLRVADLRDIIKSKEMAGRPKDIASLTILRDTLRVEQAEDKSEDDE